MNTRFIVNDYALIWNLLFQASISETIYNLKQKLWETYKSEYNITFKDKDLIMKDYKNFIPTNDTIYNIILENKDYKNIKKQTEKYRLEIMELWDKNKKETNYLIANIIRKDIPEYNIFVVTKELDLIDHPFSGSLVVGKKIEKENPLKILLQINMNIIENNIKEYSRQDEKFKRAILELAILNEYATKVSSQSYYQNGSKSLSSLKRRLYPYWLMYLGVPKEEFANFMLRDNIAFDIDNYAYETELKKMNIEEFIDFCIRNQRYIIKEQQTEII